MTKIFCDAANIDEIKLYIKDPLIDGVTTNPTLMNNAGVKNYENFARSILSLSSNKVMARTL